MKIHILNGPNLNLVGERETQIYGTRSFSDFLGELHSRFPGEEIMHFQSNLEGDLVSLLQKAAEEAEAVVINPGGFSHTSVAIADVIAAIRIPVIEVHISNIHARGTSRRNSLTGANCRGIISGFGLESYALGIQACLYLKGKNPAG